MTYHRSWHEGCRSAECDEGRRAGVAWATEHAAHDGLAWPADTPGCAVDLSGWNVEGRPVDNCREVDFREDAAGLERIPSEPYLKGFAKGAAETFDGVGPRADA